MTRWLIFLLALALVGCPTRRGGDDDDSASGDDDDATGPALPDPADGEESDGFWTPDRAISTPEEAWPAGQIDSSPFYIEATVPQGASSAWYVFEATDDFTFLVALYDGQSLITDVHVHDGNGLVLGDELPVDVTLEPDGGGGQIVTIEFDAEAGNIYVLEIQVGAAGFF